MHIFAMSNQIKHFAFFAVFFIASAGLFCADVCAEGLQKSAPLLRYRVLHTYPHDSSHFTQGLIFRDGKIIESVGRYGHSALIEKELTTGKILRFRANSADVFAEGLANIGDTLYQLTWKEHVAWVYNAQLQPIGKRSYATEGWGLTALGNPAQLVMSDGSAHLYFLDPKDFSKKREITVHYGAQEIPLLNELEVADGLIYANLWLTDLIAVIDPTHGDVLSWLDLSALKSSFVKPKGWDAREHVLNGIAYDPRTGHFYVTGKCWPTLFEIQIDRRPLTQTGTATPQ